MLSGYIAGNDLDNVIVVGNKYIKSYSGCNLIDGALSWNENVGKEIALGTAIIGSGCHRSTPLIELRSVPNTFSKLEKLLFHSRALADVVINSHAGHLWSH